MVRRRRDTVSFKNTIHAFVLQLFTDLLQTNDENNQNKFLNVITKPVGPVGEAFKYLRDNGILGENEKKVANYHKCETLIISLISTWPWNF